MAPHFQLRIKTLKFISAVDRGAQGPIANVALIKRAPTGDAVEAMCKVALLDEKLGLVFGWACVSTVTGGATPHIDLQKDAIVGGDDLIKVAAEFMEASAKSDVMHDLNPDGRILFALPLTADVKTALNIQSDVEGLAIAMKPSPETFKRFVSKELNAFSIYGEGERILVGKSEPEPAKPTATPVDKAGKKKKGKKPKTAPPMDGMAPAYKRIGKRAVFTTEIDGHVHQIDLDDPACCWSTTLCTSYQNAAGSEYGHSHPWIYDTTTGAITIGPDSGHTHTVSDVVPADVLADAAAKDEEPEEVKCDPCTPCPVEDKPSGPTVVVVAARAPDAAAAGDSTQAGAAPTVVNKEQEMPTEAETIAKQATDLTNLRKMLVASLALTEPMRLHVAKLAPTSVDEFLSLDSAGRDAAVAAALAADPEVYKTASGVVIRKSDGAVAKMLAEQADANATIVKAQAEEIAKARALTEQVTLEKRASTELSHFAKGVAVSAAILKALDGIADEAVRKDALEAVKGANFALATLGKPIGAPDGAEPKTDDPKAQLDELAKAHAAKTNAPFAKAYDDVLQTAEGGALYAKLSTTTTLRAV